MHIKRPMCLVCLVVTTFLLLYMAIKPPDFTELAIYDQSEQTVTGTVQKYVIKEDGAAVLYLTDLSFSDNNSEGATYPGQGLVVYTAGEISEIQTTIRIGSRWKAKGTFALFDVPENEGGFDSRLYYGIRGYGGMLYRAKLIAHSASYSLLKDSLQHLRRKIEKVYFTSMSEEDAGILSAMILGNRSLLDSEIKTLYSDAGIAHILSLSGLHIATLGIGLMKVLKRLVGLFIRRIGGMPAVQWTQLISATVITVLLVLYYMMTGGSVSCLRAIVMFEMAAVAALRNRTYDLLSSAAFSSMVVLMIHPLYVLDAGFQLSFGAVVSIGILAPAVENIIGRFGQFKILQGLNVGISITLGMLPINAFHFYQIPIMGLILNLVVIPLMSLVLYLGIGMGIFGILFDHLSGAQYAISKMAKITSGIFTVYRWLAEKAVALPAGVWVIGKPKGIQVILYYVLLIIGLFLSSRIDIDQMSRPLKGLQMQSGRLLKCLILSMFTIIACVILRKWTNQSLQIRNLSVGQGDCCVVSVGNRSVSVIDCGSSSRDSVGRYILIPCLKFNGVDSIDTVLISHFDSDHVNGITDLLSDPVYAHRIGRIVISSVAPVIDHGQDLYGEIIHLAKEHSIPVYTMEASEYMKREGYTISCLSPSTSFTYQDTNEASLVFLIDGERYGFRGLFTGDLGVSSEEQILAYMNQTGKFGCNYLKVGHHGSSGSSSEAFLKIMMEPGKDSIAAISVGENNHYGHPAMETLSRLKELNLTVFRTDLNGEIILEYP